MIANIENIHLHILRTPTPSSPTKKKKKKKTSPPAPPSPPLSSSTDCDDRDAPSTSSAFFNPAPTATPPTAKKPTKKPSTLRDLLIGRRTCTYPTSLVKTRLQVDDE
ncbi:hypothetical protein HK104_002603, partial [Borealophlyctis nickersoniae]